MARSRAVIEGLADDTEPHYGVSTGFGALATTSIPVERRADLQRSLIRSHAAGTGDGRDRGRPRADAAAPVDAGHRPHRVRVGTAQAYADLLNAGLTPVVREYGSLGCSGDLAPLAHCALAVMGEGEVSSTPRVGCARPARPCRHTG